MTEKSGLFKAEPGQYRVRSNHSYNCLPIESRLLGEHGVPEMVLALHPSTTVAPAGSQYA